MIENVDQRSKDYRNIADRFRPGHADYTYWKKYGIRDYRGGGRASARETASRVAAGAVARKVLGPGITIRGALVQIGPNAIDRAAWDWSAIEENPFWCPDPATAARWADYLDGVRKAGSSAGAVIEIVACGVPAGLGEPVYDKLDGDLARAMMTINAVKGVEIGAGFGAVALTGEENADEMRMRGRQGRVSVEQRRRHPRRHLDRPGHRRALRGQADQLDPEADAHRRLRRQRGRDRNPGPARPLRRHPRRAGRRGDDGLRAGRSPAAPPRHRGQYLTREAAYRFRLPNARQKRRVSSIADNSLNSDRRNRPGGADRSGEQAEVDKADQADADADREHAEDPAAHFGRRRQVDERRLHDAETGIGDAGEQQHRAGERRIGSQREDGQHQQVDDDAAK